MTRDLPLIGAAVLTGAVLGTAVALGVLSGSIWFVRAVRRGRA